jgi:DNA recombination protein RmuC
MLVLAFTIAGVFAMVAAACAIWAVRERGVASAAALEASMLRQSAADNVEALRGQATVTANAVAEAMVTRATETFAAQDRLVRERLEAQLKPVAETLDAFHKSVAAAEKARAEEAGGFKQQIGAMIAASAATQDEARKLARALGRGAGVQGRWGEQVLRIVLERAGLRAGHDFEEQRHVDAEGSAHRPDVVVRLPGGGVFVIDAKCSLTAFDEAQNAVEDADRSAAMLRHVTSLRGHAEGLSRKAYWDKLDNTPDFVAMFVPSDGLLAPALDHSPNLLAEAMDRKVIIVTPSTLFGLCKVVALGWRAEMQTANAREVAQLGRDLYSRISTMTDHVVRMGAGLKTATDGYNRFVGSLESQVLTQAKRFETLQVEHQGKAIPDLEPLDVTVRPLTKLAATPAPALTLVETAPTSGT